VDTMVGKPNKTLGMLKRTFENREPGLWKDLYVSLVRPHLEYAVQAWNPHLQGDIDKIERVQRRATRIPTGFDKLEYEDRFKRLSLTTLQDRRMRGDLIETYKVMSGKESIDWVKPINLRKNVDISGPAASVRGNSLSTRRESFSSRVRNSFCSWATIIDNFFVNRVVQTWNSFPNTVVFLFLTFYNPTDNSFRSLSSLFNSLF